MFMTHVEVTYYAMLREQRGHSTEQVQTHAQGMGALYDELAGQHGFRLPKEKLKVARNDEFVDWTTPLHDGDRIAFIPPVAGG